VGSIIPLPDVPTSVVRGGDWTLQRLEREVAPPVRQQFAADGAAASTAAAKVILETKIDALDITVLEGGASAVGQWALQHGFLLTDEKPKLLAGHTGLNLERSEAASVGLLSDLRSDKGMDWVPPSMWFSYLHVATPAGTLDYDLAVSTDAKVAPTFVDTGIARPIVIHKHHVDRWPIALGVVSFAFAVFLLAGWSTNGR